MSALDVLTDLGLLEAPSVSQAGKGVELLEPRTEVIPFDLAHDNPGRSPILPRCCPGSEEPSADRWRAHFTAPSPE